MKLSKRILDLVRAGLTAPKLSGLGKQRSPQRLEAQLEHIRKSLIQAAAREKRLRDELRLVERDRALDPIPSPQQPPDSDAWHASFTDDPGLRARGSAFWAGAPFWAARVLPRSSRAISTWI